MRLDHATKHMFFLPGIVLAALLRGRSVHPTLWPFIAGAVAAVLIALNNYVINEWLDGRVDAHHPAKSTRPSVRRRMDPATVWRQWAFLAGVGVAAAFSAGPVMGAVAATFAA
jgi:4-hydroxybenzoate polyprenyltransferase